MVRTALQDSPDYYSNQGPNSLEPVPVEAELDLLPPASLNRSLWRSIFENLRDRIAPQNLPPLQLTSRPVNTGMLVGDVLSLPWYRTVFTNLGNVITPEVLPPLELESQPVDVGELLGDRVGHLWWTSLLGNVQEALFPEKTPILDVTSKPVTPEFASGYLLTPTWSALIDTPKIFLPDTPEPIFASPLPVAATFLTASPAPIEVDTDIETAIQRLRRDLWFVHVREALWVSLSVAGLVFLVVNKIR
jgi:hypothetical protein